MDRGACVVVVVVIVAAADAISAKDGGLARDSGAENPMALLVLACAFVIVFEEAEGEGEGEGDDDNDLAMADAEGSNDSVITVVATFSDEAQQLVVCTAT